MMKKAALGFFVVLIAFLAYVATREGHFHYERSGVIHAPAGKIFPYLSHFEMASAWSPYEKRDPGMAKKLIGPDGQVGSAMEFDSQGDAGSGRLDMLKIVPDELVELKLTMTRPMHAENIVQYKLTPDVEGTRFTWSMSGDGGFMVKLVSVFVDCEKMVAGEFSEGIANLKAVVEAGP